MPLDVRPVFPHRCIRCGAEPTTTYRATTRAIGWWSALFASGPRHEVDVPACKPCAGKLRWHAHVRLAITIALIGLGVWIGFQIFDDASGWRRWAVGGIALATAVPYILWCVVKPPVFDMTAYSESVDYEFADEAYADEFLALNCDLRGRAD